VNKLYILLCGFTELTTNSRHAVKFYKAHDWKSRMTTYIDDFKEQRVQLQEVLSLYTASNVKVLVTKMENLLSQLLGTKPDWEKTLATMIQKLGDRSKWIDSDAVLQDLVSAAEDPVLGGIATKMVEHKPKEMQDVQSIKLSELRAELKLSLDDLCNRNMNIFESKLAFRTQQLQDAIESSAQFVVRTLSGPYDRLLHEVCPFAANFIYRSRTVFYQDLRELWKEMVSVGRG
jgi:hypothetical protein